MWTPLESPPFKVGDCNLHTLNDNELLAVPTLRTDEANSLWKYNIKCNKWIKWHKYPTDLKCGYQTSCIDVINAKLYIFGDPGHVTTCDLRAGLFETSEIYHDGAHARSLFINQQFHIFGGWNAKHKSHFIYNPQTQKMTEIHKFKEIDTVSKLTCHSVIHIKSKNSVLIIPFMGESQYLYSLETKKCEKISVSKAFMTLFQKAIMTLNEKYAICLMGQGKIDIMDLTTFKPKRSCTEFAHYFSQACIRNNNKKQTIVTNGYIRTCSMIYPPDDIINIIAMYTCFEILHILGKSGGATVHQSISVDEITSNLKDYEELPDTKESL